MMFHAIWVLMVLSFLFEAIYAKLNDMPANEPARPAIPSAPLIDEDFDEFLKDYESMKLFVPNRAVKMLQVHPVTYL